MQSTVGVWGHVSGEGRGGRRLAGTEEAPSLATFPPSTASVGFAPSLAFSMPLFHAGCPLKVGHTRRRLKKQGMERLGSGARGPKHLSAL